MGFPDLHIPKHLQEDIKNAVPHLRIILPAAAAVAWVFGRILRPSHNNKNEAALLETIEVRFQTITIHLYLSHQHELLKQTKKTG